MSSILLFYFFSLTHFSIIIFVVINVTNECYKFLLKYLICKLSFFTWYNVIVTDLQPKECHFVILFKLLHCQSTCFTNLKKHFKLFMFLACLWSCSSTCQSSSRVDSEEGPKKSFGWEGWRWSGSHSRVPHKVQLFWVTYC